MPHDDYIPPKYRLEYFTCPYCNVTAVTQQIWTYAHEAYRQNGPYPRIDYAEWCVCQRCRTRSLWCQQDDDQWSAVWPLVPLGPKPHPDMPDEVRQRYLEAQQVSAVSPAAGGALLRVALEALVNHLAPPTGNRNLNDGIGELVRDGKLSDQAQKIADTLRVNGNDGLHPGLVDPAETTADVATLFGLLNFIVEECITRPGLIASLWEKVPDTKKAAIARRDSRPELPAGS